MVAGLDAHALFRRLGDAEVAADAAAGLLTSATEEGIKVARNAGQVRRPTACTAGRVARGPEQGRARGHARLVLCALGCRAWATAAALLTGPLLQLAALASALSHHGLQLTAGQQAERCVCVSEHAGWWHLWLWSCPVAAH